MQAFDLVDASMNQTVNEVPLEIKPKFSPLVTREKEALVYETFVAESVTETVIDFIGVLSDAGTHRGAQTLTFRAEPLHCFDGCIGHTCKRASPPGVGCPHDTGLFIRE